MKTAFYGQYLLYKGIVNAKQLTEAVQMQEMSNMELGRLAVERGLLRPEQVKETVHLQMKEDLYFGEAAIRLGFLTKESVDKLLKEQKENHLYLGDALVKLGYLTEDLRKQTLEDFAKEQSESLSVSEQNFPKELLNEKAYVDEFSLYSVKMLQRMGGVLAKYDGCQFENKEVNLDSVSVQVKFDGTLSSLVSRYAFMVSADTADILATKIYKKTGLILGDKDNSDLIVDDRLVGDVISELVNVICGQVCSRVSRGDELKGGLPQVEYLTAGTTSKYILANDEKVAIVSLSTPYGSIFFFLVFLTCQ